MYQTNHNHSKLRIAMSAVFLVNGIGFASWVPHIPYVQQKFSLSESSLGFCLLSIAAGALISMPVTGWLIGRYGSKNILKVVSVIYCCILPTLVAAPSLPLLVLALFLFGATNGSMDVSMNAHGVLIEKQIKKSVMSSFHGLFSLGGLIGAGIGGLIISQHILPTWHVLVTASILMIIAIISVSFLLPKQYEATSQSDHQAVFVRPTGPLIGLGIMAFFILMVEGAMGDWTAIFIDGLPNATEALSAGGFAAFSLAMATGRLTGDFIISKTGKKTIVRYGILVAAVGLTMASLGQSPVFAIIGFALVGIGLANVTPTLFGAGGKVDGVDAGRGIAAVTTSGYAGFLVGPPLIGFIAEYTSLKISFLMLAMFFLIVAVYAGIVEPGRKQKVQA